MKREGETTFSFSFRLGRGQEIGRGHGGGGKGEGTGRGRGDFLLLVLSSLSVMEVPRTKKRGEPETSVFYKCQIAEEGRGKRMRMLGKKEKEGG